VIVVTVVTNAIRQTAMLAFTLGKRAGVAQAQAAAKYNDFQYKSFRVGYCSLPCMACTKPRQTITHEAATNLLERNARWTRWTNVPSDVKTETLRSVNAKLAKEQIPEIRGDVFDWRMSKALPDAARVLGRYLVMR
jgi:hypothetical protein